MVVGEHVLLMVCGLDRGTVSALVSIVPALPARGGVVPVAMVRGDQVDSEQERDLSLRGL